MTAPLRIEDDFRSDVGLVRGANEDSLAALRQAQVWVVADGMGGHDHGKIASSGIVAALQGVEVPDEFAAACDAVGDAIHAANAEIFAEAQASGSKMGSTVVALVIRHRRFAVLWAGDSRAYVFRGGSLHQLTHDHTQVQEMVDRGLLSESEAAGHPMSHVLARAVGVGPSLELDAISDDAQADDLFLLCSDGLHGVLADSEIAAILAESGKASVEPLVAACLERGAPDNVSVILVKASEPTQVVLGA
jgi:serine/threonine protein phosphatase PrpC